MKVETGCSQAQAIHIPTFYHLTKDRREVWGSLWVSLKWADGVLIPSPLDSPPQSSDHLRISISIVILTIFASEVSSRSVLEGTSEEGIRSHLLWLIFTPYQRLGPSIPFPSWWNSSQQWSLASDGIRLASESFRTSSIHVLWFIHLFIYFLYKILLSVTLTQISLCMPFLSGDNLMVLKVFLETRRMYWITIFTSMTAAPL